MKSPRWSRITLIVVALVGLLLTIAACVPAADEPILSRDLGPLLVAQKAGEKIVIEPTPVPPKLIDLTEEEIYAGLPEEFATALASANPENGPNVALVNACVGCHAVDPEQEMTGPTWHNLGDTAISRQLDSGVSPALYVYNSILAPGDYIVAGYDDGLMPATYQDTLSTSDLADVVAYILDQYEQ